MNKIISITFFYLFFCNLGVAQNDIGTWNTTNFNLKLNSKWQVFAETQLRSLKLYDDFHYYEYKGGATFKVIPNFYITSGLGSFNTYSEGGNFQTPLKQKEIRTWLQLVFKNPFEFIKIEHRYRAEQRFTSNGYKNRFRYRISANIPLFQTKKYKNEYHILAWNEIFLTNQEPFFERNRVFFGGGMDITKNLAIQTGYIYQFDYKINDESGRDFFNLILLYSFDFKGEKETTLD